MKLLLFSPFQSPIQHLLTLSFAAAGALGCVDSSAETESTASLPLAADAVTGDWPAQDAFRRISD